MNGPYYIPFSINNKIEFIQVQQKTLMYMPSAIPKGVCQTMVHRGQWVMIPALKGAPAQWPRQPASAPQPLLVIALSHPNEARHRTRLTALPFIWSCNCVHILRLPCLRFSKLMTLINQYVDILAWLEKTLELLSCLLALFYCIAVF